MGIVFFLVVTPTGLIMKILKKDLLKLKKNNSNTYWLEKDIIFGDTVTLTAFSPTLNRTENLVNGSDYDVMFEAGSNKSRRIQLTGTYIPYSDDVFQLNVTHPAANTEYNNKYKKQSQIRFDNNKLYYYIDADGMLVARYAENYDYAVGPQ